MFHHVLDLFQFPRSSFERKKLNYFQRLTFGWLWTDDPQYGRVDFQLDREAKMHARRNKLKRAQA